MFDVWKMQWLICGPVSQLKEDVAKGLEGFTNKQRAGGQ